MSLIKKSLPSILSGFTKVLNELDAFNAEQAKRAEIALNNDIKLRALQADQLNIIDDAHENIRAASAVRAKVAALIE